MKIAVITAMPEEFRVVFRWLKSGAAARLGGIKAIHCQTAGHDFVLVQSGMGFDNAAKAAETVIRETPPDLIISAGFCGGITPEVRIGDVVVAHTIVITNESGVEEVPVEFSGIGQALVTNLTEKGKRAVEGTFVSTRAIMPKAHLAGLLADRYRNPVVEMESGAIALAAAEHSIPLLAIRAVSDAADEELGFSLDEFCDPELRCILFRKVLLKILRKPAIIPQLIRLSRSSRKAAEELTTAMAHLFPLLENPSSR